MKSLWMVSLASLLLVAPAAAQRSTPRAAQDDPVKAGVEAYERGDYRTAIEKWRPAADQGNADAQFNMGQAYKLGRGVPADPKQAEAWYRKAALQGHEQAEGYYGLALFENGKRSEAVQWLQRAVSRDDARAQYILGIMLFNGDGVQKDWVRAYALMVRASSTGLDPAIKARAQMDQFMPLDDRQKGLALSRKYEEEYRNGGRPLPPVEVAENSRPAAPPPVVTRPAEVPAPRPRPRPVDQAPAPAVAAPIRDGGWRIQLGAFGDPANARKLWAQVGGRFPGRQPYFVKAGTLTKLLVGPYASRAAAAGACGSVKPCVPVAR
ncbi:SPOR domain-containing protein [Sphingomonas psychrotolerans]|uniref:SPOR domain-containing protein n=1 Tax=Sphingomonas psychrotolerans TaxID=1327635 RepID=A0ABU3N0S1_9SPHN|nr:SPOR domain-containing protein [Sphingomonas psychrotolerans]MDT8757464.1 SPOR domain-containing protein [Sphingomonas psychrotolerans]